MGDQGRAHGEDPVSIRRQGLLQEHGRGPGEVRKWCQSVRLGLLWRVGVLCRGGLRTWRSTSVSCSATSTRQENGGLSLLRTADLVEEGHCLESRFWSLASVRTDAESRAVATAGRDQLASHS